MCGRFVDPNLRGTEFEYSELKITPTGVGDIITYSRSIADYASMYAAIFSIILLAVLFLNLLERIEVTLFEGNVRGYASD